FSCSSLFGDVTIFAIGRGGVLSSSIAESVTAGAALGAADATAGLIAVVVGVGIAGDVTVPVVMECVISRATTPARGPFTTNSALPAGGRAMWLCHKTLLRGRPSARPIGMPSSAIIPRNCAEPL